MLRNIPLMLEITREVVKAVKIPVTVKTRLGWDADHRIIVELAEQLQDCGIAALSIHGRTRAQMYTGEADWSLIGEVKHYLTTGEPLPKEPFGWYLDILKQQVTQSVERLDERRGILHIRRHLAATSLFKGISDFKQTRVAMLRAETVEELFRIMDEIPEKFATSLELV